MIKCPYCNKSHYQEGISMSTCMYFPPIWKDGVNVNPDRNQTTTQCTCLECNKEFIIVNGEVQKVEKMEPDKQKEAVVDYSDLGSSNETHVITYVNNKPLGMYQMIADENELRWFFEHVIQKPAVNESYSMVFVSRHKKLSKEEQKVVGLTRKESEFLATQSIRLGKFKDALYIDEDNNWTFENFLKRVRRFNVDKYAYTTALGEPLPTKTLAIIFYVNPCDDIKVVREFVNQYLDVSQAISKAMLGGKTTVDNLQSYQWFGNAENNLKHLKANQKGTRYWMDFDLDVPTWWKEDKLITEAMLIRLQDFYGKGNYVIVDTSGGYHILVKTSAIKADPHIFCKCMTELYRDAINPEHQEYLDEKGVCKFECIVNDSQIPGLPLPGTYQYDRPVTVLNKGDF